MAEVRQDRAKARPARLARAAQSGEQAAVSRGRLALEAVKRIDALFDIERDINGLSASERLAVRQEKSAPLMPLGDPDITPNERFWPVIRLAFSMRIRLSRSTGAETWGSH